MLSLRFTTDCQARTKNGQPPQSTVGVARMNSIHVRSRVDATCSNGWPGIKSLIAIASSGMVRIALVQKRRPMSFSSGLSAASAVTVRGSRAMPQIGHVPGSLHTICGCIGQTYSIFTFGTATGPTGSSAIPHFGQLSGPVFHTSGCMGQVYSAPLLSAGFAFRPPTHACGLLRNFCAHAALQKMYLCPL